MRHDRPRSFLAAAVAAGIALGFAACASRPEPADLVVLGGRIVTMDPARPDARALAARGAEIIAVGTEDEMGALVGRGTEVIDLHGATAVPGLIEAHAHFLAVGKAKMQLDLRSAPSWDAIVAMAASAADSAASGEWILGRGWHQEKWLEPPQRSVEGLPVHDALSRATPDNPVLFAHASGHAVLVNECAMRLAGIDDTTPDPPGGEIVRDGDGRAIGALRETAEELVTAAMAASSGEAMVRRQAELAGRECLANGIASLHDAGTSLAAVDVLRAMAEEGALGVRLWVMLGEDDEVLAPRLAEYRLRRLGNAFLTVGGIKRLIDGALGSHGAWLLEPYEDLPSSSGLNTLSPEDLAATAQLALEHGYQLCVHAIGDRANRVTLDVFEGAVRGASGSGDLRWRIEHAQHLHPDDVPRFARLGVIAAMQPVHCTSDGPWVVRRIGEARAARGAYGWRTLLDSGAVIAAGTDAPVEDVDPIANFHAAVTRRMAGGDAFYHEESMTRFEAMRSMTIDAAYAAFEDDIKGSLEVGKLADITVLTHDLLEVPEEEILDTRVLYTIVGGEVRYRADWARTP